MVLTKVGAKTFTLAGMNAIFGVIILLPSWELKQQNRIHSSWLIVDLGCYLILFVAPVRFLLNL